jgi:hypothetical protein
VKIGILTFHFSTNYGALFQAYGLRSYLISKGHEVEFINYQPDYLEAGGEIKLHTLISKATLTILYLRAVNLKEKYFGNKNKKSYFNNFQENYLGLTSTRTFKDKTSLENAKLDYDVIVTGSDQVWNPSEQYGVDSVYYLDFQTGNANVKKISYAPSFGKSTLEEKYHKEIGTLIRKLDAVSIREQSGAKIVEKITGSCPTIVPDPTVLISDFEKVFNPYEVPNENYLFCYYLRSRETIGETAEYLAAKEGLVIYTPHNPHRRWKEIGKTVYPGPREWLYMLKNAKFVVTNSFHGTILSILLNKPFISVGIGSGEKSKYNERAMNILSQCGLEHRLITHFDKKQIDRLKAESIDWTSTNEKVARLRKNAFHFLTQAIGKVI